MSIVFDVYALEVRFLMWQDKRRCRLIIKAGEIRH